MQKTTSKEEQKVIDIINDYSGLNLVRSKYEYNRYDAEDVNYIVEIKIRKQIYKDKIIEFSKYTYNKEYAKMMGKQFLYVLGERPSRKVIVFNMTDIDNQGGINYKWKWMNLPETTEYGRIEKQWKFVGFLPEEYNCGIIEV